MLRPPSPLSPLCPPSPPTSYPRPETATHLPNHPRARARRPTDVARPTPDRRCRPTAGQKEQEANNWLEKRYKTDANPALSYDDTVQLALACLQNVLGSDLKADDVEVRRPRRRSRRRKTRGRHPQWTRGGCDGRGRGKLRGKGRGREL